MNNEAAILSVPCIALLPLVGAVFAYLGGRTHKDSAGIVATAASALSFILTLFVSYHLPPTEAFTSRLFTWFSVGDFTVGLSYRFDALTAVMCLIITGVGTLIHIYSTEYMRHDEGRHRYFAYLNLFLFSMLTLVMASNLPVMFIGWEGVGLCSYLLIGYWFTNPAYARAGMKAFIVNRIGDAGFLLAIFLLYWHFSTVEFTTLAASVAAHPELSGIVALASVALFVGATGKSAQIPLFVWLPDAMAGPTPVSALIHAATMVTAGVYMMARMHFLFVSPEVMSLVAVIALATAFVAATTAVAQNDIKKVLAYSTVSQLGFMFMAAAYGAFWVALFHVVTHAFFKACLFLGAGSVIHSCHHEQDMRKMGGLWSKMPLTALTYLVSVLAIAGIFPLAGYQSKHAILTAVLQGGGGGPLLMLSEWIFLGATLTAGITAFYMTRSFVMTFLGTYRGEHHPHESPALMVVPLLVLATLAVVGGVILEHSLPHYLAAVLPDAAIAARAAASEGGTLASVFAHAHEGLVASSVGFAGIALALVLYLPRERALVRWLNARWLVRPWACLFAGKYFVDEIYDFVIQRPAAALSRFLWRGVDEGALREAVDGVGASVEFVGEALRVTQSGQLRHYFVMMLGGVVFFLVLYLSVG